MASNGFGAVLADDMGLGNTIQTMLGWRTSKQRVVGGGVGFNLRTATDVVHYDWCYNPAREK